MSHRAIAWSALTLAACFLAGSSARADEAMQTCESLATALGAKTLYVSGSSAADPLVLRVARQLLPKKKIAIIYQPTSSCTAVRTMALDTSKKGCSDNRCITGTALFMAYPTGETTTIDRKPCRLNATDTHVDIALSDVHYETCASGSTPPVLPTELAWLRGPAVAMTFAVPASLKRTGDAAQATGWPEYISDDEAYSVFGLSCGGGVEPWTDASLHFTRGPDSGTTAILARAMGVPAAQIWGSEPYHDDTYTALFSIRDALRFAESRKLNAIGFLPSSILDDVPRTELKALAFRAHGQRFAFAPDSTPSSSDKLNVRKGRYVPFGYLHLFVRRSDTTEMSPTRTFYELFSGIQTLSGFDLRDAIIASHYIPACAMEVERTTEEQDAEGLFKDLKPYKPTPHSCSCYFESRLSGEPNVVPLGCITCSSDTDCKGQDTRKSCVDNFCVE